MDHFYSLGFLVGRASVSLTKSLNAGLEAHNIDLPHAQFIVLRCLYYKDALSQLDIAQLLFKDAAAIKRTVDLLEKKGLVIRKQVRTLKNSICITEKGRNLMPHVLAISDSLIDKALDGIAPEHQQLLRTMLDKIYTNLEKE
jgi:DNA-binding MarR family transcriptional regulator